MPLQQFCQHEKSSLVVSDDACSSPRLMANAGTRLEPLRSESTSVTLIKDYGVSPGQGHFEGVAMPKRVKNAKVQRLLSYHGSFLLTTVLLWCLSFAIASPATALPETLEMVRKTMGP